MNTNTVTSRALTGRIIVLLTLATLYGCATMNKQDCLEGNWQAAGFKDAVAGRTTSRFPSHVKACAKHGVGANKPTYLGGYNQGLQSYCLPNNGIEKGSRNHDYRGICPVDLEQGFLEQYILGLQLARRELSRDYRHIDYKLGDARFLRARLHDGQSEEKINRRISSLRNKLDTLRTERYDITRKIQHWRARLKKT